MRTAREIQTLFYKQHYWKVAAALLLATLCESAAGMAYCALRDPVKSIYSLFPEADGYRSSIKTVGREARSAVLAELPFLVHFNELGSHTLYVVLEKGETIGFVQARSELGDWGITEYAWGITPSGTIKSVQIQRSRDPAVRNINAEELALHVKGKSLEELSKLYKQPNIPPMVKDLITSAMKTLVLTKKVWHGEFAQATASHLMALSIARSIEPSTSSVQPIEQLYDSKASTTLTDLGMHESPVFRRAENRGFLVRNSKNDSIALLVRTPFDLEQAERPVWWYVRASGQITSVFNESTMQPDIAFAQVVGHVPGSLQGCKNLVDLAALEIVTLQRRHLDG